jgi:hypothetical protein
MPNPTTYTWIRDEGADISSEQVRRWGRWVRDLNQLTARFSLDLETPMAFTVPGTSGIGIPVPKEVDDDGSYEDNTE